MKYSYTDIVIEVTRRCNMCCAHCMRGDAENIDIPLEYIDKFFEHVESVGCITFTGGEPTLNLDAIEHTLQVVKDRNIDVGCFYLVTNGKKVTDRFLHLMIDWTVYCLSCNRYEMSDGMGGIALSQDMYHAEIDPINILRLQTLAFFRPDDKRMDYSTRRPIKLGRARNLDSVEVARHGLSVEEGMIEGDVALTVTGDILPECDYEFSETENLSIANVDNIEELFDYYKSEEFAA